MKVRTVQKRFAEPVRNETKTSTIRAEPWEVNCGYELRYWRDKPYASKQQHVAFVFVYAVFPCTVSLSDGLTLSFCEGVSLHVSDLHTLDQYAQDDGFTGWEDMKEWFLKNHGKEMLNGGFNGYMMRFARVG